MDGWEPGERHRAGWVSAVLVGATLVPLLQYRRPREERVDGFPLSWYPMFSARRRRWTTVGYAVGIDAAGTRRRLPSAALGPAGLNQVRRQLNRSVREGRAGEYAAAVARRLPQVRGCAEVTRVEIVRGRVDLDRWFDDPVLAVRDTVVAGADVAAGWPGPC